MFDHRREHPFYGICRRTGGELDHTVAKRFLRRSAAPSLTHTEVGSGHLLHLVVSNYRPQPLPDIERSFGRSNASRIDTSVRGDVIDLAARSADIH